MTWHPDFDPCEQGIIEFMAGEHGVIPTEDTAQELLQAFEDSEEFQAAYCCRPLTADFTTTTTMEGV